MSLPVLALLGRPNVGKSTLFNRLSKTRSALVYHLSGLTKDRQYALGEHRGKRFRLIDTAGWIESPEKDSLESHMRAQTQFALFEADTILLVLDAKDGLLASDLTLIETLRKANKRFVVVLNKADPGAKVDLHPFFELGADFLKVSAAHSQGLDELLEVALEPFEKEPPKEEPEGLKIALLGRPNVGKSTLANQLLGEPRQIVFDAPGTTIDSIHLPFEREGKPYVLIDTAGVRRRRALEGRTAKGALEKFSILKTLEAVEESDVVLLLFDAKEGLTAQDIQLLELVLQKGRAGVMAFNKWDELSKSEQHECLSSLEQKLRADVPFRLLQISALKGTGLSPLFKSLEKAYAAAGTRIPSSKLTTLIHELTEAHPPPRKKLAIPKLKFAHQNGTLPPSFVIHGNPLLEGLSKSYVRYLGGALRAHFKLQGTPIRLTLSWSKNPYTDEEGGSVSHWV